MSKAVHRQGSKIVDSQCRAFQQAIDVLGRPWNALILNVLQAGPLRFSELSAAARGPGDKVLSARLRELEGQGLILREVAPGPPVRVTYQLTDCGRAFGDVASSIERWGRGLHAAGERPGRAVAQPTAAAARPVTKAARQVKSSQTTATAGKAAATRPSAGRRV